MKEIYLVHVDGYIGAYNPEEKKNVKYELQDKFVDFVLKLKKIFPEHKLRCVVNEGITEYIRKKIIADKLLTNKMQNIR